MWKLFPSPSPSPPLSCSASLSGASHGVGSGLCPQGGGSLHSRLGGDGCLRGDGQAFEACSRSGSGSSDGRLQSGVGLGVAVPGSEQVGQELGTCLQVSLVAVVVVDVHDPEAVCVPVLPLQGDAEYASKFRRLL
jgi:hypothetical protein